MATIEQSLKLHDNFSKVLSKIDQATQNTLGTFEKLGSVMNKEVRMAGTDQIEKSLASIDEQSGKVIQGVEKMQQTMDKMLENSNQKPLIEAEPTVRELNTMEQATERTSGIFDRIRDRLSNLRGSAVTESLVKPDATVDALETIEKHSKNTQKTLGEIHFGLEDSVGRAEQRFELLREQMRLQGQEVRMLKGHLDSLNESDAGQEAILKQERALNRANQAYLRNIEAVNKSRNELSQLKVELDHVTNAMSRANEGRLNGFSNPIQRSVTWIQTLIDKKRESRRATEDNINVTNRLAQAVKLVKFGVWVMALRKVYQMLDNVASKIDEMTNIQTRLNVMLDITGSEATLQELNDQIMASSMGARSAWQDTANFVARVGKTTNIFGDPSEIVAFSGLLQKSLKASGASAEEMKSSMDQVALALQRGKIEGRELRTLMQNAPLVVKSIADHFNMTTQELTDMAGEGMITADAIKNAMFASADEIEERFAEIPITWADRWTQVRNVAAYAIEPLRQAFNDFINSETAEILFNSLAAGFVFVAQIAQQAFQIIEIAAGWVAQNIDLITLGLAILGSVAVAAAIAFAVAWAIANWPLLLIVATVMLVITWLHNLGITADMVVGFMVGSIMFLGTVIYNVIVGVIGVFHAMFQFIYNQFTAFYNNVISVAEFFMNVWNNPVYSVQMLFYNMVKSVLGFFGSIADGAGSAGDAIADAFMWGVNSAIKGINWLMDAIRKIPIIGKKFAGGSISLVTRDKTKSAGDNIRALAEGFNPGDAPDNYNSLDHLKLNMTPVDGLTNAIGKMASPMENYHKGYERGSNLVSGVGDFTDNFGSTMGQNTDMLGSLTNKMGETAKGLTPAGAGSGGAADKLGKGKEVGDVGKIKSDVSISDEDLKYLRDIAETNYIIRLQQISPHATVNYSSSGGDTEQDAKKLLGMMEDMIVEQVATNLL